MFVYRWEKGPNRRSLESIAKYINDIICSRPNVDPVASFELVLC